MRRYAIAVPPDPRRSPDCAASSLVGRERERAILRDHLDAALVGRGGLVLIGGEAGIGKTALAEALCRDASDLGALVLVGRCYDMTETPPYGPWVELLGRYQQADDLPPLPEAFARRGTISAVASQAALFQQVLDFFTALAAARPVLLLLDDLHWADAGSLDLLRFVARHLAALPVLLVVTYRSDELTRRHPLAAIIPALVREVRAERLAPGPLDAASVRALVDARYRLPEAEAARLVAFVQRRAEGNALFVGESLRALVETGTLRQAGDGWHLGDLERAALPSLLRQVIDARVARLDGESQRLLTIAAVIGQEMPLSLWGAVAEVDEETLLAAVEAATAASLITEAPDGLHVRFAHALIREAVYEAMSPARRRLLHRRIAELLADQVHPDPDAVVMHFQRAADNRAAEWLVKAGERAQLAYAWLTAIERYEAALSLLESSDGDLGERGWLRYRIARLRRFSMPRQGIEYLDEALRIAAAVGDAALAATARYTRGLLLGNLSEYAAAIRDMSAGCDALEALPPGEQERLDLGPDAEGVPTATNPRGFLVFMLALTGHVAEALALGEATREGMPRHTPLGEMGWAHYGDRYMGLAYAYALAGRPAEAAAASERARDRFRVLGHHATHGASTFHALSLISLSYRTERLDEHWRLVEEATAAWGRAGTTGSQRLPIVRMPVLMLTGQWTAARKDAEALRAEWLTVQGRETLPLILAALGRCQGRSAEAWTEIRAMLPDGPRTVPGTRVIWSTLTLFRLASALHLDAEEAGQAREWLVGHDRWLAWSGAVLGLSEGQALWARYHRQAVDTDKAREHAERALAHATEPRQPLALLVAHRLLGELDTEVGRYADADAHLAESLRLANACAAPYERALTLLALAELHAARGERAAALRLLDTVRAICLPLDAAPTLARAQRLTAVPHPIPAYPAGLSAREVEVLRLVSAGLTNPQVAARLFLSPRTVQQHLHSIYSKLGVPTRAAATRFALEHHLG